MATFYILFSKKLSKHYVGSCKDIEFRFEQHQSKTFENAYTTKADDWTIEFQINDLDYRQARQIEFHVKRMKSKKFFCDLIRYPEIGLKLVEKYKGV